jgi:hypothetical protein
MIRNRLIGLAALAASSLYALPAGGGGSIPGVLSGSFAGSGEWTVPVAWGDGVNELRHIWSVGDGENSGYAYGTWVSESNVDIYNAGVVDPLTVTDASAFIYSQTFVEFFEGETVFFRGQNGFYGAWIIDDMYLNPVSGGPATLLDARWYFVPGGGDDFTVTASPVEAIPEPGSLALLGMGLIGIGAMVKGRRRRPVSHARGNRTGSGSSGS